MAERARAPKNGGADATVDEIEKAAKSKGKAAKAAKAPKKNAGPVSDETVDMHIKLIREAKENWQKARDAATQAQGVLRNRRKVAKGDGVDMGALDKAFAIEAAGTGATISEQRNVGRYLRRMGVEIGHQWTLFDDVEDETVQQLDATAAGEQAGLNGEPKQNNPHQAGTELWFQWNNGHQIGADKLTDSFRTGKAVAPAEAQTH